jgi:hypothetical protein
MHQAQQWGNPQPQQQVQTQWQVGFMSPIGGPPSEPPLPAGAPPPPPQF